MSDRPRISCDAVQRAWSGLLGEAARRMRQKGDHALVSVHEILGCVTEEYHEVAEAVHDRTSLPQIRGELVDLAVACLFGIACVDERTLDW